VATALVVGAVATAVGTVAAPAAAAPQCSRPAEAAAVYAPLPWPQRWFQPDRVWPLSRGAGVTVAVVDSGVDGRHPQLGGGRVQAGFDALAGGPGGDGDCDGHGTAVASIIASAKVQNIGFAGLAPGAVVLPVRVADTGVNERRNEVSVADMAEALTWAADNGARVINVSVYFTADHAPLRTAVEYAQQKGALVVAAVGNHHDERGTGPDATPYPAAYPGVVGVGAINEDGGRLPESYVGPHVDVVAPGGRVVAAARAGGHSEVSGTSFAAPFVSATAALLIAADGTLTADRVRERLIATADPPPGPALEYGRGVVNPYRALTERAAVGAPASAEPVPDEPTDEAALARERRWRTDAMRAGTAAAVVAALAVLLMLAGPVARRGRRGRWRPRQTRRVPEHRTPLDDAEQQFYDVPRP
jgi:type VII secretion-associated serine protease mycosin